MLIFSRKLWFWIMLVLTNKGASRVTNSGVKHMYFIEIVSVNSCFDRSPLHSTDSYNQCSLISWISLSFWRYDSLISLLFIFLIIFFKFLFQLRGPTSTILVNWVNHSKDLIVIYYCIASNLKISLVWASPNWQKGSRSIEH